MIDIKAHIPDRMVSNIRMYFGGGGEEWLASLPGMLLNTKE